MWSHQDPAYMYNEHWQASTVQASSGSSCGACRHADRWNKQVQMAGCTGGVLLSMFYVSWHWPLPGRAQQLPRTRPREYIAYIIYREGRNLGILSRLSLKRACVLGARCLGIECVVGTGIPHRQGIRWFPHIRTQYSCAGVGLARDRRDRGEVGSALCPICKYREAVQSQSPPYRAHPGRAIGCDRAIAPVGGRAHQEEELRTDEAATVALLRWSPAAVRTRR